MSPASGKAPLRGIGPESIDAAGELAPKVQEQNEGHELIKHVAASHPAELVTIQQLEEDAGRTKALDEDEVRAAAVDLVGDEKRKGGLVQILSARVRGYGKPVDQQWVVVLYETPSGRNARCAVPYEGLTDSQEAYDEGIAKGTITEGKATDASDKSHLEAQIDRQAATIKRLETQLERAGGEDGDDKEKERLQAELDEANAAKEKAEQEAEDARAGVNGDDEETAKLKAELEEERAKRQAAEEAAKETGDGAIEAQVTREVDLDVVELPEGNAEDLVAGMPFYSDDVVAALIKRDERKTVVKAAKEVQAKRAEAAESED